MLRRPAPRNRCRYALVFLSERTGSGPLSRVPDFLQNDRLRSPDPMAETTDAPTGGKTANGGAHQTGSPRIENAEDVREMLRTQAERGGEEGRQALARWFRDVTVALADAGTQLQTDGHAVTALAAHTAAGRLGQAGRFVEGKSMAEIADGYADFARRRPGVAIGLAFAAGFGAAALLQARQPMMRYAEDRLPDVDETGSGGSA
jgi:hypothetical protein